MFARYSASTGKNSSSIAKSPSSATLIPKRNKKKEGMNINQWKESLLNVDTEKHKETKSRNSTLATPTTMKRAPAKNRWEQAADLMFKKEQKKKDKDLNNIGQKAKFETHVQRMLLGRVKTRSQKKFDILRQELIMAKQPIGVVAAASKSLAGFRVGAALENMIKRQMRWGFFKWHRLLREAQIEEQFEDKLDGLEAQIDYLKTVLARQNKSIMATVERTMKRKIHERRMFYFRRWNTNILWNQLQRAHHKQNTNENRLCRRVCMKMLNAKLSAAWEAWQEHNRLKLLLDRVGARWLKQGMVRCMNTWKCNAKESKRLRSLLSKVKVRFLKRSMAACWNSWKSNAAESVRNRRLIARFRARFTREGIHASFLRWHDLTKTEKRNRSIVNKFVQRFSKQVESKCFQKWRATTVESKHLKHVGNKVIKRMMQRKLAVCYSTWSDNVTEQIRLRVVCQRVGARWLKAGQVACLVKWRNFTLKRLDDKQIVRTWLAQVENREIASAWRSWSLYIQWDREQDHKGEIDALRSELDHLRKAKKAQEDALCRRVCLKLLNSKLNSAWETWREHCRLQALLERVGARWLKQGMMRCMNTWKESTIESLRLKNVCKRVAARWHKAGLVRIFKRWMAFAAQRQDDRNVVRRWLVAVENREISSAWRSWVLFVRDMSNADRLAEMQSSLELTNQNKVDVAAKELTKMIQQKVVELRTEMNSRDQLVLDLRRQLTSQKQVGAHVVELREKLARSKANHQRVRTELNLSQNSFEAQIMDLRGSTGSRLTSLEIQIEREKRKSTAQLEQERTEWSGRVIQLEQKIVRAKELMLSKNKTIKGLRLDVSEKETTVVGLEKEKKVGLVKIKELKFRLHELVLDQVNIVKSQREIEDSIREKHQKTHGKVETSVRLDKLEKYIGTELKLLNNHLDNCGREVESMKQSRSSNLSPQNWKYKSISRIKN